LINKYQAQIKNDNLKLIKKFFIMASTY